MTVIDQVQTGPRIPGLEACRDGLRPLGRGFDEIGALLQRAGVSRLACLTGLDSPSVPVWSCIRPRSKSLATSFGKGLTEPQAQISAVMEALESAHAEDCVARVCRTASLDAILAEGCEVVPLLALSRCTGAEIDGDLSIRWVEGRGLRSGAPVLAPLELVGLDYSDAAALPEFTMASIGLGAHTDPESAARHALLELIEHHSVSQIDQFPGFPDFLPRLGLDDAPSAVLAAIETTGLGPARPVFRLVPGAFGTSTVLCTILRYDSGSGIEQGRCFGVACRADLVEAALAALVEAAQVRMGLIAGAREDLKDHHYRRGTAGTDLSGKEIGWRYPGASDFAAAPPRLAEIVARMEADGAAEPCVFDLTGADDPITVVRVLAPGLTCEASTSRRLGSNAIDTLMGLARLLS